jgi:hypothetical protein
MPYQGKFVHLLGDLLEVLHVVNCEERIIHQIFGDDVLYPLRTPAELLATRSTCSLFS